VMMVFMAVRMGVKVYFSDDELLMKSS